jgi:hypothetical protein
VSATTEQLGMAAAGDRDSAYGTVISMAPSEQLGMAAAGDRDSAYGTVISMAPSYCQSTFVLQLFR